MMKKISKLALLAAATAFLLAAFPACSDDDDDDNKTEQTGGDDTGGTDNTGGNDNTGNDNTGAGSGENTGGDGSGSGENNGGDNTGSGNGDGSGGGSGNAEQDDGDDGKDEVEKILAVTYDLENGLPSEIGTTEALINASWKAPTANPTTNDVTFSWVATTNRKVKTNSGLQFSNGTAPEEAIKLSAEENITVKVTYKFAGDYASDKIREIDVGDKVSKMEASTNKATTFDVTCSPAKEVSIKANGVKILKIETAAAQ